MADDADIDHYYVFSRRHFGLCYERTVGSEADAVQRVQEIQARGREAMFLKNELPREHWFY